MGKNSEEKNIDIRNLVKAVSLTSEMANHIGILADRLIAYLIVVSEVTQKPLASIGYSFQMAFDRMANIEIEDLKNICNDLNVSNDDFGKVLDSIAARWKNYTPLQQTEICNAFADIRHVGDLRVLMENYETVIQYLDLKEVEAK